MKIYLSVVARCPNVGAPDCCTALAAIGGTNWSAQSFAQCVRYNLFAL